MSEPCFFLSVSVVLRLGSIVLPDYIPIQGCVSVRAHCAREVRDKPQAARDTGASTLQWQTMQRCSCLGIQDALFRNPEPIPKNPMSETARPTGLQTLNA